FEMNDLNDSGALFHPGLQHLTGDQVLRFSRDRHNFANGDITRTNNQGIAILGALATLRAQNPGPAGTMRLVAILARHVRARNMSILDLYRLARLGLSLDPANIKNITIPVASGPGTNLLLGAGAARLFAHRRVDRGLDNNHGGTVVAAAEVDRLGRRLAALHARAGAEVRRRRSRHRSHRLELSGMRAHPRPGQ